MGSRDLFLGRHPQKKLGFRPVPLKGFSSGMRAPILEWANRLIFLFHSEAGAPIFLSVVGFLTFQPPYTV